MRILSLFRRRQSDLKLDFLDDREHFIPFRINVLLEKMLEDSRLDSDRRESLKKLRLLLADRFHYEYHRTLEKLKDDFAAFDPDRETRCEPVYDEETLRRMQKDLYDEIRNVLKIGNYIELKEEQLAECLKLQPVGGLSVHVDTDDFDEFHVYYRGVYRETEKEKYFLLFEQDRELTFLKRVFVLARYKKEFGGRILAKMFKDVAVENIKIIAPKVKLGLPIFDRLKIGGTVLGSAATALYKLVVAVAMSWWIFALVLGGLLFAAFKGVMSFLNSRTKYMHVFSSSLYFRSISNNRAALTSLVDAAEEQEVKEALLGFFVLFLNEPREMTLREIDEAAEDWLEKQFGYLIDFEVNDSVRKLTEKDLVFVSRRVPVATGSEETQEVFHAHEIHEALGRLDRAWDEFNSF